MLYSLGGGSYGLVWCRPRLNVLSHQNLEEIPVTAQCKTWRHTQPLHIQARIALTSIQERRIAQN